MFGKEVEVPDKTRQEWRRLVRGELKHEFKFYVFQIRVHHAIRDIQQGKISEEKAIDELHALCSKYKLAAKTDLQAIFN